MSPIHVALVAFLLQQMLLATLWLVLRTRTEREAISQWALAALLVAGGVSLIALRGQLSPWIGVVLANVLVFMAVGLTSRGIWRFAKVPMRNRLHVALTLGHALVLTVLLQAELMRELLLWSALTSTWMIALSGLTIQRHMTPEFGRRTARLAALPLWVIGSLFAVRTLGLSFPGSPLATPLNANSQANVLLVLAMMCSGLINNIALMSLVTLRLTRQLEYASHHDELTGLMNRRRVGLRLAEEFVRAQRYPQTPGLLAIDVDHFKHINDRYGHPGGDRVLQAVAHALRKASRDSDSVARVGGEEFWVLMPNATPTGATQAAQRMLAAVRALRIPELDAELTVSVSIGVAVAGRGEDAEALTHQADAALYRAKAAGRDRAEMAQPDAAEPGRALPAQAPASSA